MIRPAHRRRRAAALAVFILLLIPSLAAVAASAPGPALLAPVPPEPLEPPGAHLAPPPGTTSRISVSSTEVQALAASAEARISGDGRYVAFTSAAGNLVAGDSNGAAEVFVRDLQAGTTERLPILAGRFLAAGGQADQSSISATGEFVAFRYRAPGTSDGEPDTRIYLWQRGKGTVEVAATGNLPSFARREPAISPDGLWVAYSGNPPAGLLAFPRQVYAWNRQTGQTLVVSSTQAGAGGNAASAHPSVSSAGTWIAFESLATNLAGADNNPQGSDVFVKNLATGAVTLVTPRPAPPASTTVPVEASDEPAISADGRFVAFTTAARLTAQDTNTSTDVYRWGRESNALDLISINAAGNAAAGSSVGPAVSGDGRYVTWASAAPNIIAVSASWGPVPPPAFQPAAVIRGPSEIYLRDLSVPESIRISVTTDGASAGSALRPSVADSGRRVTFDTAAANLVSGDTNQVLDILLRDLPPVPSAVPNPLDFGSQAVGLESLPAAVIVGNDGWADLRISGVTIAGANAGDFRLVADSCSGKPLARGLKCPLTLAYKPTAAGTRTAELRIDHDAPGSPRTVRLRGTATDARLVIDPLVGRLGRVVIATGTGFPAGAPIKLSWLPGITPKLPAIVADAKGSFKVQVLVFHRDVLGPRVLRAEPAGGSCFPAVDARYLVVQNSGQPGGFPGSGLVRDPIYRHAGDAPSATFTLPTQAPCVPGSGPMAPVITPPPIYTPPPAPPPTPTPSPTPKPTAASTPSPTASPTPTPVPDRQGPTLASLTGTPTTISFSPCTNNTVTISVTASDASGVSAVRLLYDPPGATFGWLSKLMTLVSGSSTNGTWRTTVTTGSGWDLGSMSYYVLATDTKGNSRQLPASAPFPTVTVTYCIG